MNAALTAVLADPSRLATLDPNDIPDVLGALEALRARLLLRLQAPPLLPPSGEGRGALLTAREVAVRLDMKRQRVWELCRTGQLPHVRIGRQVRIAPAALEKWIANGGRY